MHKQQPTSEFEATIFQKYTACRKNNEKKYGRGLLLATGLPLLGFLLSKKGVWWKIGGVYIFATLLNAIYDAGMYLHFFMHGPSYMR